METLNINNLPKGSYTPVTPAPLNINNLPKSSYTPVQSTPTPQSNATFPVTGNESTLGAVGKTLGNIPSDIVNTVKGTATLFNPANIVNNIGQIYSQASDYGKQTGQSPLSVIVKAMTSPSGTNVPGTNIKNSGLSSAAGQVLVPQFFQSLAKGDFNGALKANVENPVQTWLPLLLLGKSAADSAGMGDQFNSAVSNLASPVTKAGSAIGSAVGKVAGKVGTEAAGFTTGQGSPVIGEAFKSGQEMANTGENTAFNEAMRNKTPAADLVDTAINAAQTVAEKRGSDYVSQMKDLGLDKVNIDTTPIQTALKENLAKFGVKETFPGQLDFSNSPIRNKPSAVADIKTVYEDVLGTINSKSDAVSIDALKKSTGMVYEGTSPARAFVADMQNTIGKALKDQIPEYSKVTANYAEASNFLKDLKQTTAISQTEGKVNYNTAITKLTGAMRQNNELRLEVLKQLQEQSGTDITGQIAGTSSSSLMPRGLVAKVMAGGGIEATVLHLINPATLSSLLLASPRVVGEFVQALGFTSAKSASFLRMLNEIKTLTSPAMAIRDNSKTGK